MLGRALVRDWRPGLASTWHHVPMRSQTLIPPGLTFHICQISGLKRLSPKIPSHSHCNDVKIPTQFYLLFQNQFDLKLFIEPPENVARAPGWSTNCDCLGWEKQASWEWASETSWQRDMVVTPKHVTHLVPLAWWVACVMNRVLACVVEPQTKWDGNKRQILQPGDQG